MNFQAVRNANGQNVTMSAIATAIEGTSYIPSGTPKQDCKFTDANGELQSVTIWQGKGVPLPIEQQGLTLSINISCKPNNQGRINYGGFWNSKAQTLPINPQILPINPQPSQQAPSQPAQGQKFAQPAPKATNNKDRLIVAQVVYKELSAKFGNPNEFDLWLVENALIMKRHADLIEQVGNNTLQSTGYAPELGTDNSQIPF